MGRPADLVKARGFTTLEDTFIDYLESAEGPKAGADYSRRPLLVCRCDDPRLVRRRSTDASGSACVVSYAYAMREALELVRDPIRMGFALLVPSSSWPSSAPAFQPMWIISSFAVLDRDNSHESRTYLEELRGSTLFHRKGADREQADLERRMQIGRHHPPRSRFLPTSAA